MEQESYILSLRSSLTELGGAPSWNCSHQLYETLIEIFPTCSCAEVLSKCLPDEARPVVVHRNRFSRADSPLKSGELLYLSVYDASWFLERRRHDSSDVLPFFAEAQFLPIADFSGGVFGLRRQNGEMGLRDTCLIYSEYGDEAFSDLNRFDFGRDLAEMMKHAADRVRSGSVNRPRLDDPF